MSTYSVLAIAKDEPMFNEICSILSKEPDYSFTKLLPDFGRASMELNRGTYGVVIILDDILTPAARSWLKRTIDIKGISVITVTRQNITAAELQVSEKLIRTCCISSTDVSAAPGIARNISIRLKLISRSAPAPAHSSAAELKKSTQLTAERLVSGAESARGGGAENTIGIYPKTKKLIAVGASMGGVETVTTILKRLPKYMCPVVVTQHMPEGFTEMYAKSLNLSCAMRVVHAQDKMHVEPETVYIAPGGYQMRVKNAEEGYMITLDDGEKEDGHKPSVTALFNSVAKSAGRYALGIILTGMGGDGASGLLAMRRAGARTLGQDEASSVVYGMPKVAYEMGAVQEQVSMNDVHTKMIAFSKV